MRRSNKKPKTRYDMRFYKDRARIQYIQLKLCERAEEMLAIFGALTYRSGRRLSGPCPVHGGDRQNAFAFYPDGHSVPGFWRCYSHQCEQTFGKTVLGCIRGMMSHQKGWVQRGMGTVDFADAVDWACDFLQIDLDAISPAELEALDTENPSDRRQEAKIDRQLFSRRKWRSMLRIPEFYFSQRRKPGWSPEILDRYDVGYCDGSKPLSDMRCRSVAPVYDDDYKWVIGYTGRSIFDQCKDCKGYHFQKDSYSCPDRPDVFTKWKNARDFNREQHFYNSWFAKQYIQKTRKAVLVEGPGEVWRAEEAKIPITLACFGVGLTERQQIVLEMMGIDELFICMNNDEAGLKSRDAILEQVGDQYKCHPLTIPKADFGEMEPRAVSRFLKSKIK